MSSAGTYAYRSIPTPTTSPPKPVPPQPLPRAAQLGASPSTTATRPFDSQVRQTIVTVIRAHTQPDAAPSWSHLNYDFTGAHLENANFRKAQFTGTAIFDGAQFTSRANFRKAKFTGTAIFGGAQFTGTADFDGPVGVEDDPL